MRVVPRLCEFYPGICLTTEEKSRKNLSQGKTNLSQVKKNLSQSTKTSVRVQKSQSEYKNLSQSTESQSEYKTSVRVQNLSQSTKISEYKNLSQSTKTSVRVQKSQSEYKNLSQSKKPQSEYCQPLIVIFPM